MHRGPRNSQLRARESGGVWGHYCWRGSNVRRRIWSLKIGSLQWRWGSEFGYLRTHGHVRDMRWPTTRQGTDETVGMQSVSITCGAP